MGHQRAVFHIIVFTATACIAGAASAVGGPPGSDVALVEVNGQTLTLADLERKNPAALFQARSTYYETERKAIEGMVDTYLLETQAAKEGVTVPELMDRHVNSKIAGDPSEEALRVYYEGVDTTEPYEAVRSKIVDALRERRLAKAKTTYLQSLRSQVPVVIRLAPPRAPVSMTGVPVRGVATPRVTLLEYADYECPVCQQIQPVLSRLEKEFEGQISFAFKDFPLNIHPDAQKAAEAAQCAGAQGKYWQYHDALFTDRALAPAALKTEARNLALDTKVFDACLDGGQMAPLVQSEATEAMALGFPGTPTILINGRYVNGAMTYDRLRAVITEELSASSVQTAGSASAAPLGHGQNHIP